MVRDQIVEIGLHVNSDGRARDRVISRMRDWWNRMCELRGDRFRQVDLVLKRDSKLDARRWPISEAERHAYEQVGSLPRGFHELGRRRANGFSRRPTDLEDQSRQAVGGQAGRQFPPIASRHASALGGRSP